MANITHLLESFIDGLNSRRPALFNVYAVCPPEHGVGDDSAVAQSKMAVESRAFPLFRYNPDLGVTFSRMPSPWKATRRWMPTGRPTSPNTWTRRATSRA